VVELKRKGKSGKRAITMMGKKERSFAHVIHASLEGLVPADHFYRHLERTLDLSFVREFVQETSANKGRPWIDPVVFWHRCNWSCSLKILCDAQIAYFEWEQKYSPRLVSKPVTNSCVRSR
jgi:hypothetical protein